MGRPLLKIDRDTERCCTKCGVWKERSVENFCYRKESGFTGWETICRKCKTARSRKWMKDNHAHVTAKAKEWKRNNPEKVAEQKRRHDHGLTNGAYLAMYQAQEGKCLLCLIYYPSLHVDHCHETKIIRGLLCRHCNMALGQFKDDVARIARAVQYLEESRCKLELS